jgi:antitoxin MazE
MLIHTHLIQMGNTQGIPIPSAILEQLSLDGELVLEVLHNQLIIRPLATSRQHWAAHFQQMAAQGDDVLLDSELVSASTWDEEEWEW